VPVCPFLNNVPYFLQSNASDLILSGRFSNTDQKFTGIIYTYLIGVTLGDRLLNMVTFM